MPQIRLIAGLGNPGPEYAGTRHNVGFMVVDHLAAQFGSSWEKSTKWGALTSKHGDTLLAKPMSFMNRSGYPLVAIAQFYKIAPSEILVVLDDLALPLGRIRIRPGGGTGGHNGLESIIMQFGTEEIPRLRIGIGAAPRDSGVDYVLGRFFEEERPLLKSAIERGAQAIECAVDNGVVSAMNTFNQIQEP
ncbi:MAG: aminoacyl-tRNA hydrolase [Verrucomicrobia bacterium]|nr:MAG: aminoacyl-tRNA hydrolase [Verrucomicrobiota bacterium]PYL85755.1 MAG: aminoacyl-tRNA hydrolase [Verrucomicrobiota bacterium]PYL90301.1 MAG: aminoacyl-tRNA hydrolase [Verrucomicrobiota bacterium]